jgi:hypothetical protein
LPPTHNELWAGYSGHDPSIIAGGHGLAAQRGSDWARRTPVAERELRRDNREVIEEGHLYGDRVWFYDTRSPVRRMGISTHPFDSTVVISLWQGDICTGTFRLPVRDSARLISTLAYGMTEALPDDGTGFRRPPKWSHRNWPRFLQRLLGRWPAEGDTHLRLLK